MSFFYSTAHSYEMVIGIACFSYFMSILIRWFSDYSPEQPPSNCILAVINNSVLRAVLGIQFANVSICLSKNIEWNTIHMLLLLFSQYFSIESMNKMFPFVLESRFCRGNNS